MGVNELLSGERLEEVDYKRKAEENMVNLVKEAQESKKKIILSVMVATLSIIAAMPVFILSDMIDMDKWIKWLLIFIGCAVLILGISIACILDRDAGAFECSKCHERFVPDMKAYVMGPHTITRRKLKCPKCGVSNYCKHVLTRS